MSNISARRFFSRFHGTQLKSQSLKKYRTSSSFLVLTSVYLLTVGAGAIDVSDHTRHTHTVRRNYLDKGSARRAVTSTWQHTTLAGDIHPYRRRD